MGLLAFSTSERCVGLFFGPRLESGIEYSSDAARARAVTIRKRFDQSKHMLAWYLCLIVKLVSGGSQNQIIRYGNSGGFLKLRGGCDDDRKVFPCKELHGGTSICEV